MDKKLLQKIGIGIGAVLFFLGLSYSFVPEVLDGKIVNQADISHYVGMSREMTTWNDAHPDDPTQWTGSMFSGMPTTPITIVNGGDATQPVYDFLLLGKRPATYLFIALLGGFLLMLSLGIDWLLAIAGAVAIGFCSYNFQIIEAGHNTKMQAIAFIPWVLAALIWTYKMALKEITPLATLGRNDKLSWWAKTVLAASLFGLALSLEIKANHVQITYYLALMILLYAVTMIVWVLWKRRGQWKEFLIASALLLVLGGLGIATNANKLMPLNDYQPVSIRGGSELKAAGDDNARQQNGLDLDYMTVYSYGWNELPNLFIPNWNGGGNRLEESRTTALLKGQLNDARRQQRDIQKQLSMFDNPDYQDAIYYQLIQDGASEDEAYQTMVDEYNYLADMNAKYSQYISSFKDPEEQAGKLVYWGPQLPTKGPLYVGCITVFLFILGLCLYEGKEKWWLLVVAIMASLLAIGYNSDGTYYYGIQRFASSTLPMYSKFRTVNMILVLMHVALPMLGFLVLDRILKKGYTKKQFSIGLGISSTVTLLFFLIGGTMHRSFMAPNQDYDEELTESLLADRHDLLISDMWACFLLVLVVALILAAFYYLPEKKENWLSQHRRPVAACAIGLLILGNMFSVGHRYLNENHFITPKDFKRDYAERPVDKEIKRLDPNQTARVMDYTEFSSAIPSYHHRCIGGYSPAKLQRYEDLMQHYIYDGIDWNVLSALNARYIIRGESKEDLQINDNAYGSAWFVEKTYQTESPDEELYSLRDVNLKTTAVLGPDFRGAAPADLPGAETDTVELLSYAPNEMRYRYNAASERILVFSEIYHKDWVATVDGQPLPLFRADWILRAAVVPAGKHEIVMRFEPAVYERGRNISRASSIPLLLIVLLAAGACIWLGRKAGRE